MILIFLYYYYFFFFNDTATTEIYTLSLHDALPIFGHARGDDRNDRKGQEEPNRTKAAETSRDQRRQAKKDRKSTRLNSSHGYISYAVFCLKKKKKNVAYIFTKKQKSISNIQMTNT